ncbi:tripartite tricarboxylate transporter substrate binding protein [Bordetella sp. LUAb4]|uniref:Bug family tripartite tricarboxylate transporter substrate binding protein n=1 Tax=Bordetella sp. LUAb4 TaxID=2843195 RepID=UPI001E63CAF4|nr:tripartite tricarboxylate transporter substrate-binding protein [Bordetella sp. LUAb4]
MGLSVARSLIASVVAGSVMPISGVAAESSASYPERPIKLVLGFPPGGATDSVARQLAKHMGEDLGQQIIVDYRPGAAGNIGAMAVARAPADGYTLYLASRSETLHKKMYGHMNYDFSRDLVPVGMAVKLPFVLLMGKHVKAASIQEAIGLARERPGSISCASTGMGSTNHLLCEALQEAADVEILHLPYKGMTSALTDIVGGRTDLMFTSLAFALPYLQSDAVRCMSVISTTRLPELPDVPSIEEFGFMRADGNAWFAIVAPARTPSHVISRLNRSLNNVLAQDLVREAFTAQGFVVPLSNNTPEALGTFMGEEAEKWTEVLEKLNVSSVQ